MSRIRGHFTLADIQLQRRLKDVVTRTGRSSSESAYIFVSRPSGATNYTLLVSPQGSGANGCRQGAATIFITDPAGVSHLPTTTALAARFGLTATEAEVALLTAAGQGVPYVAETLRMSLNTARTHLKSIYSKLEVNHQAQMTRLIIQSFPPVTTASSPRR